MCKELAKESDFEEVFIDMSAPGERNYTHPYTSKGVPGSTERPERDSRGVRQNYGRRESLSAMASTTK